MGSVAEEASIALRVFMLNQQMWPDEIKLCEQVLLMLEEYK